MLDFVLGPPQGNTVLSRGLQDNDRRLTFCRMVSSIGVCDVLVAVAIVRIAGRELGFETSRIASCNICRRLEDLDTVGGSKCGWQRTFTSGNAAWRTDFRARVLAALARLGSGLSCDDIVARNVRRVVSLQSKSRQHFTFYTSRLDQRAVAKNCEQTCCLHDQLHPSTTSSFLHKPPLEP